VEENGYIQVASKARVPKLPLSHQKLNADPNIDIQSETKVFSLWV